MYQWDITRREQSRNLAQKFVEYFIEDAKDSDSPVQGLKLDQDPAKDYDKMVTSNTDEITRAPLYGFDANSMTLYLRGIPRFVSRLMLLQAIQEKVQGFVGLSMSEPLKT